MTNLIFKRVLALPEELEANVLYMVRSEDPGLVNIYITGNDPSELRHIVAKEDVLSLIASAGYVKTDTKYTAGDGLTLTGTTFSLPVTVSGTGTYVKSVTQSANGVEVTLGTPPNNNTTYAVGTLSQLTAGTDTTGRLQTAKLLNDWLNTKGYVTTDTKYTASTGVTLSGTAFSVKYGTAAGTAAQGNDSRINNGQTAHGWGNHASAGYVKTDTKYSAGNGLTISGTTFSLPVSVTGSGSYVQSVAQSTTGITVTLGTPPNTNTTYSTMSVAELRAGTATTARTVTAQRFYDASAFVALTSATTITPNLGSGNNFTLALSHNATLANPTNAKSGQTGTIVVTHNGARTLSYGTRWKFPGGAPNLSSFATTDVITYLVVSPTLVLAALGEDFS